MPINPLNHHYAMENPASVFDEEAMTALELAGRTTAKVNEVVAQVNEQTTKLDAEIKKFRDGVDTMVDQAVVAHINSGEFDDQLDQYTVDALGKIAEVDRKLTARMDTITGLPSGSTADNAELRDLRVSDNGSIYSSAGACVRNNIELLKEKVIDPTLEGLGIIGNLLQASWNGGYSDARATMGKAVKCAYPIRVTAKHPYCFGVHYWQKVGDVSTGVATFDTGWVTDWTIPANTPFNVCIACYGEDPSNPDAKVTPDDFMRFTFAKPKYMAEWYPVDMFTILNGTIHAGWNPNVERYNTTIHTRMATQPFTVKKPLRVKLPANSNYNVAVHTWREVNGVLPNLFTDDVAGCVPSGCYVSDTGWGKEWVISPGVWSVLYFGNEGETNIPTCLGVFDELVMEWEATEDTGTVTVPVTDYLVKGVAHRGYSSGAPENTLPAYVMAKERGFKYVECDVRFTSDGYPVVIHDDTIDRCSNGTGSVAEMTLAQIRRYDFGSWKGDKFVGTVIPTFEEFIRLCRKLSLHPYIEIKAGNQEQVKGLINTVKRYGMTDKVTYIAFEYAHLEYVRDYVSCARLGYLTGDITWTVLNKTLALAESYPNIEIFIDSSSNCTNEQVEMCMGYGIPLEVYTVDSTADIINMNPYISGVTSNHLIAGKVLYESEVN